MSDSMSLSKPKVFSNVKYFVTGTLPEDVKKILNEGGAEKINFFSDMVTHCIVGEQPRENDISDAKDLYEVPAVSVYWVLLSAYCNKTLPTKGFIYDRTQIFTDLVITASQVTNADFKAIWAMVTFYGGKFKSNLDKSCTHLICGRPTGKKYEAALNKDKVKIVTPDWVGECVKFGSKVEEDFFHPRYLLFPKAKDSSPSSSADLSTAQILGFADDVTPSTPSIEAPSSASSTQALLEKLKQRMPWNRPPSTASVTPNSPTQMPFSQSSYSGLPPNKNVPPSQPNQLQPSMPVVNESQTHQNSQPPQPPQPPPQQVERMAIDPQARMVQQGQAWRPNTIQTVRPQYTLIQRDGSVAQAQATNWTQYHLQQQRLQPQNPAQQTQLIQQQAIPVQQNQAAPHQQTQQIQQGPLLANSQNQGPLQASGANPIQTLNPTQRQITWTQQPQLQGPPKQVIQLDPQTHAQLSQMDPHQRSLFLQKIQRQRQIILQQRQLQLQQQQQQQQQQPRPVAQGGKLGSAQPSHSAQQPPGQQQQQPQSSIPIRQQQIIIRGVMPPGLTPQQQTVWLHQQQFIRQQQILVQQQTSQIRHPGTPSPSRVVQQQTATSTWIPQADSQQQQIQLQRQQQMRIQQLQIQKQQQIVVQRTAPQVPQQVFQQTPNQQNLTGPNMSPAIHTEETAIHNQVGGSAGGGLLVNNRTKTALANMLSSRLQTGHLSPQTQSHGQADGSAAGQLRMMSAQQRAPQPPPPPPPQPPSTQLSEPQPNMYGQQQRRAMGAVDPSVAGARSNIPSREGSSASTPGPKSAARAGLNSCASNAAPALSQKPQFFAHNPSLRIPPEKYFLGCAFYIVEYDRLEENNLAAWEEVIRYHGGEVESVYTHRVTHILCETQKHGIVQQALRDGKRCITAFWLNDVVSKGSLSVPWQALHFPVPFGREKPLSKYHMTLTGFEDKCERERVATMIRVAGGQYRNYLSPLTHIVVCRKAEGAKYKKAKETNKITVNVQWLNEVLFGHYSCIQQPEAHKYQQFNSSACFRVDYSLIPHLMGAWKLPINVTSEAYNAVKNSPSPVRKTKKPRIEPTPEQRKEIETKILESVQVINTDNIPPENRPHIVVTGDKNLEVTKKAKELGCALADSNAKVTHLVICGKPIRTLKLLKSLILAKYFVKDSWLIDSHSHNKLLSESNYLIHQIETENFKCNVSKILSSPDRSSLFKDLIFYLTPNVEPSKKALTELIELSSGRVEKQRRSVKAIQELNKVTQTYIVISCYDDLALIADMFRAKLEFYSAEFVMKSITTQSIDYAASAYRY